MIYDVNDAELASTIREVPFFSQVGSTITYRLGFTAFYTSCLLMSEERRVDHDRQYHDSELFALPNEVMYLETPHSMKPNTMQSL